MKAQRPPRPQEEFVITPKSPLRETLRERLVVLLLPKTFPPLYRTREGRLALLCERFLLLRFIRERLIRGWTVNPVRKAPEKRLPQ